MRISVHCWPAGAALALMVALTGCMHGVSVVGSEPYLERSQFAERKFRPTHYTIIDGQEIVVEWAGGDLLYREAGSDQPWQVSPVELRQPHSIVRGASGSLYVSDTEHHAIVRLTDLSSPDVDVLATIAGQVLYKPHDIAFDERSGLLYVIDARHTLYRFRDFGVDEARLAFEPQQLGYSRALSVVDGTVYIVGSAKGQIVRVDDFELGSYTVFTSPGKRRTAASGSWATTGLVLNDIEYFKGYWYGTNFYIQRDDSGNEDQYSLMRWRNWRSFEQGRWEDLSHMVDDRIVPYYLFADDDVLYVACLFGKVYLVSEVDEG
jgi:hypothetical protein